MRHKNDLFRLIRSMSKTEKRYFTLDAQKAGKKDAKYLELFNLIAQMEQYDEEVLKPMFKHLSVDKAYLYDAILRSMRDYNSKKSRSAQIKEKLMDVKYLYERELFDLCARRLEEAKEMAESMGDTVLLLAINKEERRLTRQYRKQDFATKLNQLQEEGVAHSQAMQEEFNFLGIYEDMSKDVVRIAELDAAKKAQLKEKYQTLLEQEEGNYASMQATYHYHKSRLLIFQLLGDYEKVHAENLKVIAWWNEHPEYKDEEFFNYVVDASNFLSVCFRQEKYQNVEQLLAQLQSEQPSNNHHRRVLFMRVSVFEQVYCINKGKIEQVHQMAEAIENGLKQFSINISNQKTLTTNMAILFLIAEKFEDCLIWGDKVLRISKEAIREDLNVGVYFIKLICFIMLEDTDGFEKASRAARRYLNKIAYGDKEIYLKLIYTFNQLENAPLGEEQSARQSFLQEMEMLQKTKPLVIGLSQILMWWAKSRIKKVPIVKMIRG